MNVTIKHFVQTGSPHGFLRMKTKDLCMTQTTMLCLVILAKEAEALALRIADDMNFTNIQTEYYYGGKRKYKTIK